MTIGKLRQKRFRLIRYWQEAPGAERSGAGAEERSDDHASELARELKYGRKRNSTTVICHQYMAVSHVTQYFSINTMIIWAQRLSLYYCNKNTRDL